MHEGPAEGVKVGGYLGGWVGVASRYEGSGWTIEGRHSTGVGQGRAWEWWVTWEGGWSEHPNGVEYDRVR